MIVDTLENLEKYVSLNPLLAQVAEFLSVHDLRTLPEGKTELRGNDLRMNVSLARPKTKEEARLEAHRDFIDIQIPVSGTELMGYTPLKDCAPADAPYNETKDVTFFEGQAATYVTVEPGMFALFFPQDGHAPGVTPEGLKKVVVKVRV